ncbi:MAG: hypothetical protein WAV23_02055 [Minisyncoccia bacterium]
MADNNEQKKNDEETDPSVIKIPKNISTARSIDSFVNTGYKSTLDLACGASTVDIVGITARSDYQSLTLATQAGVLGVNALGENLLEMKIKTISDARNFMVGVNNVASVFSENNGLLKSIESASAIALTHGRLTIEAIDRINIPSVTSSLRLATEYHIKANEVIKLSESITTVLAYGQAVQNQFSILADSEIFKNGATVLMDSSISLGKISDHVPVYVDSETITSPFIFEPRIIKTKEVEKALPEIKKELPVKTTEAIELMEYIFDPNTKNDDKRIITTVSELKRALKNIQGSVAMFVQQTSSSSYSIGHIENFAGSIGSITDQAYVSIKQVNGFSQEKVIDLVGQMQKFLTKIKLRTEEKENIETLAIELKKEIYKDTPNQSKIKTTLTSLKTIFEGVAGNVIAQGIIVELTKLLASH